MKTEIDKLIPTWTKLLKSLKADIDDEYRASDDPGMQVTIGFTPSSENKSCSWSYQTGDNSYAGSAYGHPHWAVISLYRRSNSRELAEAVAEQLSGLVMQWIYSNQSHA